MVKAPTAAGYRVTGVGDDGQSVAVCAEQPQFFSAKKIVGKTLSDGNEGEGQPVVGFSMIKKAIDVADTQRYLPAAGNLFQPPEYQIHRQVLYGGVAKAQVVDLQRAKVAGQIDARRATKGQSGSVWRRPMQSKLEGKYGITRRLRISNLRGFNGCGQQRLPVGIGDGFHGAEGTDLFKNLVPGGRPQGQ